jgi:hypothetical protein
LSRQVAACRPVACGYRSKTAFYFRQGAVELGVLYPKTQIILVSSKDGSQRITSGSAYDCEPWDLTLISGSWIPEE